METNRLETLARTDHLYDENPNYVFQMTLAVDVGGATEQIAPIGIFTTREKAFSYIRRVLALYNAKQLDADLLMPIPTDEMWIRQSDIIWDFVLNKSSWYRMMRVKLNDYSHVEKQEQEFEFGNDSNAPVV